MNDFAGMLEELQKVLDLGRQNWLLGAGVSFGANVPPMHPLTRRIGAVLAGRNKEIFEGIKAELPDNAHVEHVLSHLGDLIALADRSKAKASSVLAKTVKLDELEAAYKAILEQIGELVRFGYREAKGADSEQVGSISKPIVNIGDHHNFVKALFSVRANLEERSSIAFFTTNYDTLLEDALALEHRTVVDGFQGGAMAFWDGRDLDAANDLPTRKHRVFKLHGSVDWFNDRQFGLVRCRYGVTYLSDSKNILIYPQATKYVETQRDPFAVLFSGFRRALNSGADHSLLCCGYSFGDNHINNEIEFALKSPGSKTNLVAFSREEVDTADKSKSKLPSVLEQWRQDKSIGPRIYVASDRALYKGDTRHAHPSKAELSWSSFVGLTEFLKSRNP